MVEEAMEIVEIAERFEHRMIERTEDLDLEKEEGNGVSKWGNEIPRMVLRVLLVEADDSTRQVVTALLRKCGYTVSAVSDGLKAWETLKESAQSIDLILTEMDLPFVSGFALLSLVMEHNVCKEIPVIMMSTQDSVSMVFKCMLKGAADYLIKPLRKNELSNLWRHVWRRNSRQVPCNLTVQQKQVLDPASGKYVPINRLSDSLTSAPTTKDRSEKGSDTQSSCTSTTPYLEAESEKVLKRSYDKFKESNMKKEDREKMDEGLIMDVCGTIEKSNLYKPEVVSCNGAYKSTLLRLEEDHIIAKRTKLDESVQANLINEMKSCRDDEMFKQSREVGVNGIIGKLVRCNNSHSVVNDGKNKSGYPLSMELYLSGNLLRGSHGLVPNEEPKMTHSNASAFSWYSNIPTLQPLFATHPNGPTIPKEAVKKSEETSPFNQSSGNSINDFQQQHEKPMTFDRYWDSHESPRSPQRLEPVPVTGHRFEKLSTGPNGQFLPSLYYVQSNLSPLWSPVSESRNEKSLFDTNDTSSQCEDRENHPSEETSYYKSTDQAGKDHDDSELVKDSKLDPLPADQINTHDKRSEECTTSIETPEDDDVKANLAPSQSLRRDLNNGQFGHEKFRGMDSVWLSQREAALAKFRMKRKDRCFHKKVRYQSRKKLAEQRPRVKGQFVRQSAS